MPNASVSEQKHRRHEGRNLEWHEFWKEGADGRWRATCKVARLLFIAAKLSGGFFLAQRVETKARGILL